jgi:integrase
MNATATAPLTGVQQFVEGEYFAHVSSSLAASTVDGYRKMWRMSSRYFDGRELGLRTCDCQAIMRQICADNPHLKKTSLRHLKNFFSGVWAHALRMGLTDRDNPWRVVQVPQAPEAGDTYAYSPEDIEAILKATPSPYDLVVLLAACTGLRKSEIRGLRWSDWDPASSTLSVNRAVWRGHVKTTKSKASKAPVPVVPILATRLEALCSAISVTKKNQMPPYDSTRTPSRSTMKKSNEPCATSAIKTYATTSSLIFAGSTGKPLDLDNLARRIIVPAVGNVWHGWHAFRRGLATFLHAQNVDDKTIQAILRHENVSITQQCYVKTVPESVRAAMATVKFGDNSKSVEPSGGHPHC